MLEREQITPAFAQARRFLPREPLRIGLGAAHRADEGDPPLALRCGGARRGDRGRHLRRRIRVAAVAEHHVEQDHRDLRVARLAHHPFVAQAMVDHRMRPAAGEDVVAEIDDGVPAALERIVELVLVAHRRVRPHLAERFAEQERRLVAERAAAEEAADEPLAGREARRADDARRAARASRACAPRASATAARAASSSVRTGCRFFAARFAGAAPTKQTTTGFFAFAAAARTVSATAGAGGFEMSTITFVSRSAASAAEPGEHREPADLFLQVAAAGADRLRNARAEPVDERGDLLQPGARGGDAADRRRAARCSRTRAARRR